MPEPVTITLQEHWDSLQSENARLRDEVRRLREFVGEFVEQTEFGGEPRSPLGCIIRELQAAARELLKGGDA